MRVDPLCYVTNGEPETRFRRLAPRPRLIDQDAEPMGAEEMNAYARVVLKLKPPPRDEEWTCRRP